MWINPAFHLDIAMISLLVLNMLYAHFKHSKIEVKLQRIDDSVNNNVYGKMYEILEEELCSLSTETEEERAIWGYYKHKLHDVQNAYNMLKIEGKSALLKDSVFNIMEGSGKIELNSTCLNISENDLDYIEIINKRHIEESKKQIFLQSEQDISTIVKVILKLFRQNVRATFQVLQKYLQNNQPEHQSKNTGISITTIVGNNNMTANGKSSIEQ